MPRARRPAASRRGRARPVAVHAGTITVSASASDLEAVVGQHREPGADARTGAAVGGADPHLVERLAGAVAGRAEDLRRDAEVERDHAVEGEHGHPMRVRCMARFFHIVAFRPLVGAGRSAEAGPVTATIAEPARACTAPGWVVAAVAFVALIGAAGFRATPGVLIDPLHEEFGWSRGHDLGRRSRSTCCCSG